MNRKIFLVALFFAAVVSQDTWCMESVQYATTALQATAVVDSDNAKCYDKALIFAPMCANAIYRMSGGSSSALYLNVGVNAVCGLRAAYLHKDFLRKEMTLKRAFKLLGTTAAAMLTVYRADKAILKAIDLKRKRDLEELKRKHDLEKLKRDLEELKRKYYLERQALVEVFFETQFESKHLQAAISLYGQAVEALLKRQQQAAAAD